MLSYAIGSFLGMMALSVLYGFINKKITAGLSEKIAQAWKHRPARFIILLITALQVIVGLVLNLSCIYMLYQGATFTPYSSLGYEYTGESYITTAWALFAAAFAITIIADVFKLIFVLTFAD
ncbi:hypothetical protein SMB51_003944 [Cronobacter sakazakii]|uniref:hypothetical protein n=1 Tax=Cronobacter sakazakii TaxID=28141 RepID=UPI001375D6BD|nr:hypothetical protein [Cronobacter sakazakii]ELY2490236.1 hypothetical protein [Cronobacter sakazakii]NCI14899.1 hypothetical protein [Cronobacter sakazakii]